MSAICERYSLQKPHFDDVFSSCNRKHVVNTIIIRLTALPENFTTPVPNPIPIPNPKPNPNPNPINNINPNPNANPNPNRNPKP